MDWRSTKVPHLKNDTIKPELSTVQHVGSPVSETCLILFPGLRPGDEILVLNGRCVSGLDLALIQTLFAEQTLYLSLRRDGLQPPGAISSCPVQPLNQHQEVRSRHHRAKSSSGA